MIIIAAPYSPPNRLGHVHLGASRKLEAIILILSRLDSQLVLVNSAHDGNMVAPISVKNSKIGSVNLVEITPPISSTSTFGKMKNIFDVGRVLDEINKLGVPQLFWFYNGYAFEMNLALRAQKMFKIPMILEFEDWHFSRSRGLNPKPYIDYFLWRKAAKYMSATFAVNSSLAGKMQGFSNDIELLPGVVPIAVAKIAKDYLPFPIERKCSINIGFFGGLSIEKGADIVLQLADMLKPGYTLNVTGAGSMEAQFLMYSRKNPNKLCFHGRVDDVKLYQLISRCDIILNPHTSIENMNNGVFPFKVIEAIASGRLLISTQVPSDGLEDVMAGVNFVEHSVGAFLTAIEAGRQRYLSQAASISECAALANQKFGENFLLEKVKLIINAGSKQLEASSRNLIH